MTGKRKTWNREVYETPLCFLKSVAKSMIYNAGELADNANDQKSNHPEEFDFERLESSISRNPETEYIDYQSSLSKEDLLSAIIHEVSKYKPNLKHLAERVLLHDEGSLEELSLALGITQNQVKNDKKSLKRFLEKYEIMGDSRIRKITQKRGRE